MIRDIVVYDVDTKVMAPRNLDEGSDGVLKALPRGSVEIGSFFYDYFPWSVSLQALVSKEKRLYGLPNNFPVNDPNFVDTIRKLYADWKREANKSFDPIRNKYPVVFEDE